MLIMMSLNGIEEHANIPRLPYILNLHSVQQIFIIITSYRNGQEIHKERNFAHDCKCFVGKSRWEETECTFLEF